MIFVDPRMGSGHLAPLFKALDAPFDVTPLEAGDCAFLGNGPDDSIVKVGVELKGGRGGSDFLQSMQSDRLVGEQVPKLAKYDRRYLIIEGLRPTKNGLLWTPPRKFGKARPIFVADVKRYITGLEESGLRVRYTRTPEQTARVIFKELYEFWQKDYDKHTSIPANVLYSPPLFTLRQEDEATSRIRRVCLALKAGVGAGRSKDVAEHFGSVIAMVNAGPEAWEGIAGVGKKTAGDVQEAVREQIPTSHTQAAPSKRVPARHGTATRSTRSTRQRQDKRVDASSTAQSHLRAARTGRRVADGHRPKRTAK